jgi:hypothetical protein
MRMGWALAMAGACVCTTARAQEEPEDPGSVERPELTDKQREIIRQQKQRRTS